MTLILDVWRSFRAMPLWVQIWVALILVPVNLASYLFIDEPMGLLVTSLAIGGMLPNLVIMGFERGLSKAMGLPHLAIWLPLAIFLTWIVQSPYAEGAYLTYLRLLLGVNAVSLAFDLLDTWKWARGDRAIAS